jgi:hypothetical protein
MDREQSIRVVAEINALAEFYQVTLSGIQLDFYVEALEDFAPEQIKAAVRKAIKTHRFFPKPVELIELIAGSQNDRAEVAWQAAWAAYQKAGYYDTVLFQDGAIARTIQAVYGGWVQFSEASRTLSPEMIQARRKEFLSTYRRESEKGREPMRLLGHIEIENQNTVSTWTRDRYGDTYRQRLYVVSQDGGRFVEAVYSRSDARLLDSEMQLRAEAKLPALPARPQLQLAPPPSERARQMTPEEIRAGMQSLIKSVKSNRV